MNSLILSTKYDAEAHSHFITFGCDPNSSFTVRLNAKSLPPCFVVDDIIMETTCFVHQGGSIGPCAELTANTIEDLCISAILYTSSYSGSYDKYTSAEDNTRIRMLTDINDQYSEVLEKFVVDLRSVLLLPEISIPRELQSLLDAFKRELSLKAISAIPNEHTTQPSCSV